ncbi:cation:dicarboxylase symporter family transporter [Desulfovibrio aminophilus]|uniref:dicarboxylate/amino acid:cation symporter n=1 Tax=Desulfovibrio aminophilus TaxID=81425 RepID=UPI00339B1407
MSRGVRKLSLPTQMAIGMAAGLLAGMVAPSLHLEAAFFKPLGQLFINLVRMVVVPLVFATLVAGAAGIDDARKLGRVATKTLIYYFATTGIAVAIGLFMANMVEPGTGLSLATTGLKAKEVTPPSMVDTLLNIVPINPVEAMAKGNMLQVIFFAVVFGFALSSMGETGRPLLRFFEQVADVMVRVTNLVMIYAPIGVFGLMAYAVSLHGLKVLLPLGKIIVVMYAASLAHVCITYLPSVRFIGGMSPLKFLRGVIEPVLVAFTTCSSAAALPSNLRSVQKLGASKSVSSFSIPLGNTVNMDGAAIYMGVAAVFVAEVYGIPMPLDKQITVLLMAMLASVGSVGVPGAALIMITMVFTQVGIPLEGIALVAGVDRVMDMARTTLNVLGDATGAVVVSRLEGELSNGEEATATESA